MPFDDLFSEDDFNEAMFRKMREAWASTGNQSTTTDYNNNTVRIEGREISKAEVKEMEMMSRALSRRQWQCKIETRGDEVVCTYLSPTGDQVRSKGGTTKVSAFRAATRRAHEELMKS